MIAIRHDQVVVGVVTVMRIVPSLSSDASDLRYHTCFVATGYSNSLYALRFLVGGSATFLAVYARQTYCRIVRPLRCVGAYAHAARRSTTYFLTLRVPCHSIRRLVILLEQH